MQTQIPPPDGWALGGFVEAANAALPAVLPDDAPVRIERRVSPRLIRYLATAGLLSEPSRSGREARYTLRHLRELLVVRRMMAAGHTTAAIGASVRTRPDGDLDALLYGPLEVGPEPLFPARTAEADSPAAYLRALRTLPPPAAAPAPLPDPFPAFLSPPPAAPVAYTRLTVASGLELHAGPAFRPPDTPAARDALLRSIMDALAGLPRSSRLS